MATLAVLLLAAGYCSASRSLQQADAAAPAPAQVLTAAQLPAEAAKSNIQINAPGDGTLLNAPALAPASAPLPAGVVSLAAKRNANTAAETEAQLAQDEAAPSTFTAVRACSSHALVVKIGQDMHFCCACKC